jgi:signal-transduction protein with cAMP-binding, CBS, and nucleotidyltransferase domain
MAKELPEIMVKDLMTRDIIMVGSETTVNEAAKKMDEKNIGSVVIMENDNPIGIMTERDFAIKIAAHAYPIFTKIKKVMSTPVIHISPEESVLNAVDLMMKRKIRKLPVYGRGEIVGIVTASDLFKLFSWASEKDMKKLYQSYLVKVFDYEYGPV